MIRQLLFSGLFIVAGLSLPRAAHADAAGEALVRNALNEISSQSGWTASADVVRSEGAQVIVEGLSIANSGVNFQLAAQRITLAGLTGRGEGYFATGASVHDIVVNYEPKKLVAIDTSDDVETVMSNIFRLETIDFVDLYLPASLGASSAGDGLLAGYINLYAYLAKVELASLNAPAVQLEQTFSTADLDKAQKTRSTYSLSATDWADGMIARYDLESLAMTVTGGTTGDYSVLIESAFAEKLDLAHTAHVLDPAQYSGGAGDGIWKPLIKRAEYRNIRVGAEEVNADIARISLTDFDMRQTEKPFLSQFESLIASGLADQEPDPEEVARMMREVLPGFFGSFRIGELRLEDMQVKPVVSSEPAGFAMEEFRIAGMSANGIDQLLMSGLSGTAPDVDVKLGTFRFDGIKFPKLDAIAALMDLAAEIEKNPDNPEVGGAMARQVMEIYPTADHFLMRDLSGSAQGKERFEVDEVRVDVTKRAMGFMVAGTGAIEGIMFPASYFEEGNGPNPLTLLNYDRFAMDLDFESLWDETTTEIDYSLNMQIEDAGDLSLSYAFSGFTDKAIEELFERAFALGASGDEDIGKIIALFSDIGFEGFGLAFTDRSIVERALTLASSQQGTDAQTYRDQLKAALPFFLSAVPPGDFRQQVIDAAQAALDGGRKTTFSLSPAATVMVPEIIAASMQDPLSLITLLGAGMTSEAAN
jgi:hypothetical protein